MNKKRAWLAAAIGGSAVVAVLLACVAFAALMPFSRTDSASYVYVDKDDTADSVYHKLTQTPDSRMYLVRFWGKAMRYSSHVHTGRYQTGKHVSAFSLIRSLRAGRQEPVNLVIPVTHTLAAMAGRIAPKLQADSAALMKAFTDPELLAELQADTATAPALFVPNTYQVYWDIEPADLLRRMKREYEAFWDEGRRALARDLELTPYEVAALASIVEQESANQAERPAIAGMYINRLRQGMKLQADPTVKFALGDFGLRRIMHAHLTTDSPYNTYMNEGLPPGPICIPSADAIDAVLNYEHHDYLYMCAKEDFSGTHNFAATYAEHLANARRYAEALNKRGIK